MSVRFEMRDAGINEQLAAQPPRQNVHGQWYCGDKYFASEADARFWQKIEAEKAADRATLHARIAARQQDDLTRSLPELESRATIEDAIGSKRTSSVVCHWCDLEIPASAPRVDVGAGPYIHAGPGALCASEYQDLVHRDASDGDACVMPEAGGRAHS